MTYRQGVLLDRPNVNPIDWASGEAGGDRRRYDSCCWHLPVCWEGKKGSPWLAMFRGGIGRDYAIPAAQLDYLRKLKKDNPLSGYRGRVTGGSPMNLAEVQELADAVLLVWYPGEEGGNAVAGHILLGSCPLPVNCRSPSRVHMINCRLTRIIP